MDELRTNSFQQDHGVSGMTYAYKLDGHQMVGANSGGPPEIAGAFNELHFNFAEWCNS